MAYVGGDIVEVTFSHPTIGQGTLFPKAAEDSTYDLGGFRGDDDANMVAGGGQNIKKMNRVRWMFEVPIAWDMNVAETIEKVVQLAGSPVDAEWTITHVNGTVYKGTGAPVGDVQGNANAATFNLKVMGGGVMTKVVG